MPNTGSRPRLWTNPTRSATATYNRYPAGNTLAAAAASSNRTWPRSTRSVARRQCAQRAAVVSANPAAASTSTAFRNHPTAARARPFAANPAAVWAGAKYVAATTPPIPNAAAAAAGPYSPHRTARPCRSSTGSARG